MNFDNKDLGSYKYFSSIKLARWHQGRTQVEASRSATGWHEGIIVSQRKCMLNLLHNYDIRVKFGLILPGPTVWAEPTPLFLSKISFKISLKLSQNPSFVLEMLDFNWNLHGFFYFLFKQTFCGFLSSLKTLHVFKLKPSIHSRYHSFLSSFLSSFPPFFPI